MVIAFCYNISGNDADGLFLREGKNFDCVKQLDVVNFFIPNLGADMQAIKFKTVVTKTGKLKIPPRLALPQGQVEVIVLNINITTEKNSPRSASHPSPASSL